MKLSRKIRNISKNIFLGFPFLQEAQATIVIKYIVILNYLSITQIPFKVVKCQIRLK